MAGDLPPGTRVLLGNGVATVGGPSVPPRGHVAAETSIISPGTELRTLAATREGPRRPAGYMCLSQPVRLPGRRTAVRVLAPVPHGAAVPLDHSRALTVPADIALALAAVARFQLIAALGLAQLNAEVAGDGPPVVAGAGRWGWAPCWSCVAGARGRCWSSPIIPTPPRGCFPT